MTWTNSPRSKYGNKRVKADGYTFDSQAEYRRWQELKLLEQAGEISDLEVHPKFIISPGGRDAFTGKVIRKRTYEGDFAYIELDTDRQIIEDTKGVATQVFRLKWDLVRLAYPDIEFRIVKA
jgi:hypothetical protein